MLSSKLQKVLQDFVWMDSFFVKQIKTGKTDKNLTLVVYIVFSCFSCFSLFSKNECTTHTISRRTLINNTIRRENEKKRVLSELNQIGLDYTVLERRPIRVASVADYRIMAIRVKT